MTTTQAKNAAQIIDIAFMLCAAMLPAVFVLVAIVQYAARRWPLACRGWLLICGVQDVRPWQVVILPGAAAFVVEPPVATVKSGPAPAPTDDASAPVAALPDAPRPATTLTSAGALTTEAWRDALAENPHLLIYGPSKAGKSTLAQAYVALIQGAHYVVLDPIPNKPGEKKWGGIDFITTDESGDEYASIKAALIAIDAEDERRRRTMRNVTHPPLIVIIDEILALKVELGMITNEEGAKEARMAQFIRTKGYSARHRNIKIILIGQGKNLKDLGLDSSTARNNYALVRVARNQVTNVRDAYLVTDTSEQAIDLRHVVALAQAASGRSHLWMSHADVAQRPTSAADELALLLGTGTNVQKEEKPPVSTTGTGTSSTGTPDTDAMDRDTKIKLLVSLGVSANAIFTAIGGNRAEVLDLVARLRSEN